MNTAASKKRVSRKAKKNITAYVLLSVPILWWCAFFLFAFVRAVYFSFTDLRFDVDLISSFNFDNYIRLFGRRVTAPFSGPSIFTRKTNGWTPRSTPWGGETLTPSWPWSADPGFPAGGCSRT